MLFIADTTVNQDPTADELADIAHMPARSPATTSTSSRRWRCSPIELRVQHRRPELQGPAGGGDCRAAVAGARHRGEMQADTAVDPDIARDTYPSSRIFGDANVLVCPDLASANIATSCCGGSARSNDRADPDRHRRTGHVLQTGVEVNDIVNMTRCACARRNAIRSCAGKRPRPAEVVGATNPPSEGCVEAGPARAIRGTTALPHRQPWRRR